MEHRKQDPDIEERARAAQRDYLRRWRMQNRDKVKAYNRDYWQRRAARIAAEGEDTNDN